MLGEEEEEPPSSLAPSHEHPLPLRSRSAGIHELTARDEPGVAALKPWGNARVCPCVPVGVTRGQGRRDRSRAAHGEGARGWSRSLGKAAAEAQHNGGSVFLPFLCPLKL